MTHAIIIIIIYFRKIINFVNSLFEVYTFNFLDSYFKEESRKYDNYNYY